MQAFILPTEEYHLSLSWTSSTGASSMQFLSPGMSSIGRWRASLMHAFCILFCCSFHLDHAGTLTYITEKVSRSLSSCVPAHLRCTLDQLPGREWKSVYDSSHKVPAQTYDARPSSHEVGLTSATLITAALLNVLLVRLLQMLYSPPRSSQRPLRQSFPSPCTSTSHHVQEYLSCLSTLATS